MSGHVKVVETLRAVDWWKWRKLSSVFSVPVLSVVDPCGSSQRLGICCSSVKHSTIIRNKRKKNNWLYFRIMCPSRAVCLSADRCFSKLPLWNSEHVGVRQTSSSSHWNINCSHHDIQCRWQIVHLTLNNNHSRTHSLYYMLFSYQTGYIMWHRI
jgi:hypothetical protein